MSSVIRPQHVPRPTASPRRGPDLRVVVPVRGRPRSAPMLVGLAVVVMFGALLLSAVFHGVLVSGQRRLDRIDLRLEQRQQRVARMRLQVAVLSSPERVVAAAKQQGMVEPDHITWLIPGRGSTSSPARKRRASPPTTQPSPSTTQPSPLAAQPSVPTGSPSPPPSTPSASEPTNGRATGTVPVGGSPAPIRPTPTQ